MAREPADITARRQALGERLAVFREAADLRQGELARLVFRDRTTVNHIEKGRARGDEQFWRDADHAVNASGTLLRTFRELEAARQAHERQTRQVDQAEARARADAWRSHRANTIMETLAMLGPTATLNLLETYTISVVQRYELEGPHRLTHEVRALRQIDRELSDQVSSPTERSRVTKLAAQHAALLAYMAASLGQFPAAEDYALEASLLATAIDDRPLLAWIKATQSYAAYYQQRYHDALNLARVGLQFAGDHGQRIRLLSNGIARAAGKLGERQTVARAVGQALELAGPQTDPTHMTSCIDFGPYGWARTAANAATAYLSLGDYTKVLQLTGELRAIVNASDSDWSRSLITLDEATALTLGQHADFDHAATVGIQALAASADKPIASVGKRATELAHGLRRRGPHRASVEFSAALQQWSQHGPKALT